MFKSIGTAVGGFISVYWKFLEFLPLSAIQLLVKAISPELILESIRISSNGLFFRVHRLQANTFRQSRPQVITSTSEMFLFTIFFPWLEFLTNWWLRLMEYAITAFRLPS
ncbi:hypothetical protein AMTR_s00008p00071980 [Amborella trichopoda]|uniref:Uncharacterized protein n=1 Tax=Amborella trichopoda TaxID=13333 RepID=W1NHL4_AMBTC|nr:hypothetical protein AMTR_s00008p00071980 [Amborella trichopoda]